MEVEKREQPADGMSCGDAHMPGIGPRMPGVLQRARAAAPPRSPWQAPARGRFR